MTKIKHHFHVVVSEEAFQSGAKCKLSYIKKWLKPMDGFSLKITNIKHLQSTVYTPVTPKTAARIKATLAEARKHPGVWTKAVEPKTKAKGRSK